MANRFVDSFRRYGGSEAAMVNGTSSACWAQVDADFTLNNGVPSLGPWCLVMASGVAPAAARRVFGAPLGEVFVGLSVYLSQLPTVEPDPVAVISPRGVCLASFRDAANGVNMSVWIGTDGALVVYRAGWLHGSGAFIAAQLDRTIPVLGTGARNHVEIYAKAGNADGAVEIRVNNVTRSNLTGIDNVATANVEFSQVAIEHLGGFPLGSGGGSHFMGIGSIYANDATDDGGPCNDFVGDCKAAGFMPNLDTAQADFALSTGANGWALIDDIPPDDATYLSLAATTGESHFELEDSPANTTEILTVRPWLRASKDDAGVCTVAPNMSSNGTKGTVGDHPVTTGGFGYVDDCVPLDPDTGLAWTPAAFDAALLVVERTA